jgi:NADH-ubiquinone oxidoreductase chain 5
LIGISSFLLINYWLTRLEASRAAIQAILFNRIGDYGYSISIFLMFLIFGDLNFTTIFSLVPNIYENILLFFSILFLIAAMAKSAQLGLHSWLPSAMEGKKILIIFFIIVFI